MHTTEGNAAADYSPSSWLSGIYLARKTNVHARAICTSQSSDVVHAQKLYYILHITFVPLSINYALGLVNNINLSLHGKLFSYITKMLATTNQQQTLLFHPESKKLKCLTL